MDKDDLDKLLLPKSKSGKVYTHPSEAEILTILGDEANTPHGNPKGVMFASPSKEELEVRRSKVQKLVMRGIHKQDIADHLGINLKTVYSDLKSIKKNIRKNVMQLDYPLFVGETMAFYEEVKQISLRMATDSNITDKKLKLAALREATNAEDSKHRFLTQAGMYKSVNTDSVYAGVNAGESVSMQDVLTSIEAKLAKVSPNQVIEAFAEDPTDD